MNGRATIARPGSGGRVGRTTCYTRGHARSPSVRPAGALTRTGAGAVVDAVRVDPGRRQCPHRRAGEWRERRRLRRGPWPRRHRRPVALLVLPPALWGRIVPVSLARSAPPATSPSRTACSAPGTPRRSSRASTCYSSRLRHVGQYYHDPRRRQRPARPDADAAQPAGLDRPGPEQTPQAPEDDTWPTPTPLPELPQLDPEIRTSRCRNSRGSRRSSRSTRRRPTRLPADPDQPRAAAAATAGPTPERTTAGRGLAVRSRPAAFATAPAPFDPVKPGRSAAGAVHRAVRGAADAVAPANPDAVRPPP